MYTQLFDRKSCYSSAKLGMRQNLEYRYKCPIMYIFYLSTTEYVHIKKRICFIMTLICRYIFSTFPKENKINISAKHCSKWLHQTFEGANKISAYEQFVNGDLCWYCVVYYFLCFILYDLQKTLRFYIHFLYII